ncbi:hypothetical protein EYF80_024370 [Liparis tanakae]|uniref:Uncharacterized protein n=1 Tax=Liparis tanakae TaxID=230148 RepID=A0A4Z2HHQ0_9TELE|nr:hypothetical protein EYF80_024370 [Liparis tanakae]
MPYDPAEAAGQYKAHLFTQLAISNPGHLRAREASGPVALRVHCHHSAQPTHSGLHRMRAYSVMRDSGGTSATPMDRAN